MSHVAAVGSHGQPGEWQVCASCLDGLQREAEQKSMPEIFRKFNKCYEVIQAQEGRRGGASEQLPTYHTRNSCLIR